MVEKRAGLTPPQIEVLEWIKAGQPAGFFGDNGDLTYRSHARWLEKYGLVSISGSGDTWRVKLTDRGRRWPEVPASALSAVTGGSQGRKPSSDTSSRSLDGKSTPNQSAAEPASASAVDARYHVQVTRVQMAEKWVEAGSEAEAIQRVLGEFSTPNGHQQKWKTISTEAEVLEVAQLEQSYSAKAKGDEPLLLSLDGAARTLGVPREVIDELVCTGEMEWIQVASSKFISRESLDKFVRDNTRKEPEEAPEDLASEPEPEAPAPTTQPKLPIPSPPDTSSSTPSNSTPTKQVEGSGARAGRTETKRPPHPGQILMTEFIGPRQKLHEIVEETGVNGKKLMERIINTLRKGLPAGLEELAQLGRTLWRRREDVLAYFDIGASNGPVEAINGRLEHLRGIALGFRNLDNYILRCLIHSGQLQNRINAL